MNRPITDADLTTAIEGLAAVLPSNGPWTCAEDYSFAASWNPCVEVTLGAEEYNADLNAELQRHGCAVIAAGLDGRLASASDVRRLRNDVESLAFCVAQDHRHVLRLFADADHIVRWDDVLARFRRPSAAALNDAAATIERARIAGVIEDADGPSVWRLTSAGRLAWEARRARDATIEGEAP